jgi:methyl-accepting chemotaxis protein
MRIPLGYKFILGFLVVVAVAALAPGLVEWLGVSEWLRAPLSFLTAMVIGLILGIIFSKRFTRHFSNLTDMAMRIGKGDLRTAEQKYIRTATFRDEATDLGEALMMVFTNLKVLVTHTKNTAADLADAQDTLNELINKGQNSSEEVIRGTSKIFDGALEQAQHIENVSKAISDVSHLADSTAAKITDAADASKRANAMVERGASNATDAIEKMESIFKGIEDTEHAAIRLKDKLSNIPRILDVITHLSRQTDLLALNATIEATKAGEHGKGFAMVAEEVRRLSDNTTSSVGEVSEIVKDITNEIEGVVGSATEGSDEIRAGRNDIRNIRAILVEISGYTSEVADMAANILGLTNKQKEKIELTATTITQVAGIARENLKSTENVEHAIELHGKAIEDAAQASMHLSELSIELKSVVSSFKVDDDANI